MKDAGNFDPFDETGSVSRVSLFDEQPITSPGIVFEQQAHTEGFRFVAGVDEVGPGMLGRAGRCCGVYFGYNKTASEIPQ